MHAKITSKGQITLPKKLRDKFQLYAGDRVEFLIDEENNVQLIVKSESVTSMKGMLPKPEQIVSLEEMDRAIEKGAGRS